MLLPSAMIIFFEVCTSEREMIGKKSKKALQVTTHQATQDAAHIHTYIHTQHAKAVTTDCRDCLCARSAEDAVFRMFFDAPTNLVTRCLRSLTVL